MTNTLKAAFLAVLCALLSMSSAIAAESTITKTDRIVIATGDFLVQTNGLDFAFGEQLSVSVVGAPDLAGSSFRWFYLSPGNPRPQEWQSSSYKLDSSATYTAKWRPFHSGDSGNWKMYFSVNGATKVISYNVKATASAPAPLVCSPGVSDVKGGDTNEFVATGGMRSNLNWNVDLPVDYLAKGATTTARVTQTVDNGLVGTRKAFISFPAPSRTGTIDTRAVTVTDGTSEAVCLVQVSSPDAPAVCPANTQIPSGTFVMPMGAGCGNFATPAGTAGFWVKGSDGTCSPGLWQLCSSNPPPPPEAASVTNVTDAPCLPDDPIPDQYYRANPGLGCYLGGSPVKTATYWLPVPEVNKCFAGTWLLCTRPAPVVGQ